jgi:minor extracellular serine protease Vpr
MKIILKSLLGIVLFFSIEVFAQYDVQSKQFIKELNQIDFNQKGREVSPHLGKLIKDYDLIFKNGTYYIGALLLTDKNLFNDIELLENNIIVTSKINHIYSVRIPISYFSKLSEMNGIKYIEIGNTVSPDLTLSIADSRTDSVHLGLGGLAMPYKGDSVIIAVIDWGFDYTHPVFYDSTLSYLRLSRAWDQNKLSGPAPQGFFFGTEYVGETALLEAKEDTLYVFGPGSHGTHVGGIAGGSGGGTNNIGMAPNAELIFISLRRDAPSLIDAFNYVRHYAESVHKPFVINMSFGSHLGPHDGSSLKNQGIDEIAGPGRIFVGSAGNNGNNNFHLDRNFNLNQDTLITVVDFSYTSGGDEYFGQTLSMWGSANSSFKVSLKFTSNTNALLHQTPFYHSIDEDMINDTMVVNVSDSIFFKLYAVASSPINDKPNIRVEFAKPSNVKAVLHVTSDNSHVHIWNNVRLTTRYTNWGSTLSNNFPNAVIGNSDYGLGEPAGVGKNVITVASHRAEEIINETIIVNGNISAFSSKGPTVDERVKPDICAPGQIVRSSVNSYDPSPGNLVETVEFNGRTYGFANYSGTSMSGPAVTGIVALMLQAYPTLSAQKAKEIIKATARLDFRTGDIDENGSLTWGWGKINALAALLMTEIVSSNQEIILQSNNTKIYPNPVQSVMNIEADYVVNSYQLYEVSGRIIRNENEFQQKFSVDVSDLPLGVYLIKLNGEKVSEIQKIVIGN